MITAQLPCPYQSHFVDAGVLGGDITQIIALLTDVDDLGVWPLLFQFMRDG